MVEWIFIELWIFIGLLIFFVTFFVFMIFFPFLVTREISCFLCSILFFSQGEPRQCNGVNIVARVRLRMGLGSDFDFDFVLFGKVNGSVGVFAQGGVVLVWSGVLSFIQQIA